MAAAPPNPNARYRPFRAAAWGLYLVVAVGYSSLVIYSVTKSVFEMSPARPTTVASKNLTACVTGLRGSFDALEQERRRLGAEHAVDADQRWLGFRNGWMREVRQLEAECDLDEPSRAELKTTFEMLERVMDLATVQATQVAGQLGPSLDETRAHLEALERR